LGADTCEFLAEGPPEYHYLGWAVRPEPPPESPLECPWLDTVEPPDEDDDPDDDEPDEDPPDDDDELPLEDGELAKVLLGSGRGPLPPSLRGRTRVYPTPFTARAAPVPSFPSSSITTTDEP
jgi:hypothetical protein